jgi:hypothetical protein
MIDPSPPQERSMTPVSSYIVERDLILFGPACGDHLDRVRILKEMCAYGVKQIWAMGEVAGALSESLADSWPETPQRWHEPSYLDQVFDQLMIDSDPAKLIRPPWPLRLIIHLAPTSIIEIGQFSIDFDGSTPSNLNTLSIRGGDEMSLHSVSSTLTFSQRGALQYAHLRDEGDRLTVRVFNATREPLCDSWSMMAHPSSPLSP